MLVDEKLTISPKLDGTEPTQDNDTDSEGGRILVNGRLTWEGTKEEKALLRKLDARILPITCLLYLFACLSTLFLHQYDC